MALLNFMDHTEKMGASVTLEHVQPHIEKTLLSLANDKQREKLNMVKEQ